MIVPYTLRAEDLDKFLKERRQLNTILALTNLELCQLYIGGMFHHRTYQDTRGLVIMTMNICTTLRLSLPTGCLYLTHQPTRTNYERM